MTPYGKGYHSPGCQLLLKLYCQYLECMGPGNNGEKEEWSHSPSLTVIDLCFLFLQLSVSWVTQSCPTLCNPMNRSTSGLPVHHQLPEFTQTHSVESVMPSSHLILGRPLLLLPPIPPSIKGFSNESTLRMRWPKYWSFSFSIIPSKAIPGLISYNLKYHCMHHYFEITEVIWPTARLDV